MCRTRGALGAWIWMSPTILFSMAAVVPTGRLLDMSEASKQHNKPGRFSMHCHPKLARELYRIEHILHGGLTMFNSQSQDLQHGFQETPSNPHLHRHSSTTSRHGHTKAAGPAGLQRVHYRVTSISLKEPIYIYVYIYISHVYTIAEINRNLPQDMI